MKRILPLLALAALLVMPAGAEDDSRPAGPDDTGRITLCTSGITNPNPPANKDSAWSGSYVYFGEYNGKPIRFRVLAKDSTAYTEGGALFLDSDVSLFDSIFDDEEPYSNSWNGLLCVYPGGKPAWDV